MQSRNSTIHFSQSGRKFESIDDVMVPILQNKTEAERLAFANQMWRSARQIIFYRIKQEQPGWTDEQIQRETARRLSHGAG